MPDPLHPRPGFYEGTLPKFGSDADLAAVASSVESLQTAIRHLNIPVIERLVAPAYVHINRDERILNRDEWLAYIRRQSADQRATPASVTSITIDDQTAFVAGHLRRASNIPAGGEAERDKVVRFVQVWTSIEGVWLRISSRMSLPAPMRRP